jgi:hypothetical protein
MSDTLYALAFGRLRSMLIDVCKSPEVLADPVTLATRIIQVEPGFAAAADDWLILYAPTGADTTLWLSIAGAAVGLAVRRWARTDGRESLAQVAPGSAVPGPLVEIAQSWSAPSVAPADVYKGALEALKDKPDALSAVAGEAATQPEGLRKVIAFLLGVNVGAKAYEVADGAAAGRSSSAEHSAEPSQPSPAPVESRTNDGLPSGGASNGGASNGGASNGGAGSSETH